jgi:hypothetical protein
MIDPLTISLIAQGVPALIQGGVGLGQFISGNRMRKENVRPEFEIPDSAKAALGMRRTLASGQEMPGMTQAETALNQQLATGAQLATSTAGSTAEALGAIQNMYANRMAGQNRLAAQSAQYNMEMDNALAAELGAMANWENMEFNINEMQPFLDKAGMASGMLGSGMQNMFQGLSGAGGAVAGNAMNREVFDMLKSGQTTLQSAPAVSSTSGNLGGSLAGATSMGVTGSGMGGMMAENQMIIDLLKQLGIEVPNN